MISTITNYSHNIDTLFPVPGQDNDSQGFRDNFANIKQSLNIAATEINNLSLNLSPITQKTVIVQGTNGGLQGTAIGLSSATIRLNQNEIDPTRSQPAISITGTAFLSFGNDSTGTVVTMTSTHGGTSWPYNNYFTVNNPSLVTLGSTFKFFNSDSVTYTVIDVNSSTVYTNSTFDPAYLSSNGVNPGSQIRMYHGKLSASISRVHTPPTTSTGQVGDFKGAIAITSTTIYVAHRDYDGVNKIWSKISAISDW
jgi:hypothetical protein